ncbi:MAG: hypothetical protein NC833_06310, partial [Candidatus Omnitrophica bacterium]|nr:hypothetical protein [Candidatus Omnitrophota bacterium]
MWAYNDTTALEEIRFTKVSQSPLPTLAYTNLNTYKWGIGAPGFYIQKDTGYTVFETDYGSTYHILPRPPFIELWSGKMLEVVKFPLNNPGNYQVIYEDFISSFSQPVPIETVRVPEFYDTVLSKLISPSICVDEYNFSNIIWDGINEFLKIYKIKNDTMIKTFYPEVRVYGPYVSKENSFIRFIWVEDSSKIYSSYTFPGKDISEKELIY